LHGQETDHKTVHALHQEIDITELKAQETFIVTIFEQVLILGVADITWVSI